MMVMIIVAVIVIVIMVLVVIVAVVRVLRAVGAAVVRFRVRMKVAAGIGLFGAHSPASRGAWGAMPWLGAVPRECSAWWIASATSCQTWAFCSR